MKPVEGKNISQHIAAKNIFVKMFYEKRTFSPGTKYYRSADQNLARATFAVSGKSLFASATLETQIREESKKAVNDLLDLATTSGFDCVVKEDELKNNVEASRNNPDKVIVGIPFTITSRTDYVKKFIQTLQPYSGRGTGSKSSLNIERKEVSIDPVNLVLFDDVRTAWHNGWQALRGRFIFKNGNHDVLFATGWFTFTGSDVTEGITLSDKSSYGKSSTRDLTVSTEEIEKSLLDSISEIQFEVRRMDKKQ